ncbi:nuclear transport factor 2 family protein [Paraburkholderia bannensis]|uniref:nuclear transport factor 2 family protein n=1 Tax=Paraburkholderia bannensis TaxID=765414 RepID=UPI00048474D0|nr:nuclear transport factor 2 family protein [Paraburkholderia bannensis]
MNQAELNLPPAVAQSLAIWHEMVDSKDLGRLESIVHPDAVFRSPMAFKPYGPAPALLMALRTVITIFGDFTYHRQFSSADGLDIVLEFSASVQGKQLKGIDMIRFDEEGRIVEFEVMIRPFNALQVLGAEMGARLAQFLPAYKN